MMNAAWRSFDQVFDGPVHGASGNIPIVTNFERRSHTTDTGSQIKRNRGAILEDKRRTWRRHGYLAGTRGVEVCPDGGAVALVDLAFLIPLNEPSVPFGIRAAVGVDRKGLGMAVSNHLYRVPPTGNSLPL